MMQFSIRELATDDVPFLWEMLFYAAHMAKDGETTTEAAQQNSFLAQYVADWGKAGDRGVVAVETASQQKIGAAWLRLLTDDKNAVSYVDDHTPELAIALHPAWTGKGIGTAMLTHLIKDACTQYPAIVLTVRADNPAQHLYERFGFVTVGEIENRVKTKSLKMLLKFK